MKTTESGGPSGCDAGKKVKGRKRHIVVDIEGLPIEIAVHAASVQDRDGAPAVILRVLEKAPRIKKIWADGGYQGETPTFAKVGDGNAISQSKHRRVHRSPPSVGRRADLRLDVALSASGEGLRAELGELFGVGAAGRVPFHAAPNRKGHNMLIIKNIIRIWNFSLILFRVCERKPCIVGSSALPSDPIRVPKRLSRRWNSHFGRIEIASRDPA